MVSDVRHGRVIQSKVHHIPIHGYQFKLAGSYPQTKCFRADLNVWLAQFITITSYTWSWDTDQCSWVFVNHDVTARSCITKSTNPNHWHFLFTTICIIYAYIETKCSSALSSFQLGWGGLRMMGWEGWDRQSIYFGHVLTSDCRDGLPVESERFQCAIFLS